MSLQRQIISAYRQEEVCWAVNKIQFQKSCRWLRFMKSYGTVGKMLRSIGRFRIGLLGLIVRSVGQSQLRPSSERDCVTDSVRETLNNSPR